MKVSKISDHITKISKETKDVPAFLPTLNRNTSEEVIRKWATTSQIMAEYKRAYKQIIVADEWMVHTRLRRLMDDLAKYFKDDQSMSKKYRESKYYEEMLEKLIAHAFKCDKKDARKKSDISGNGNIFNTLKALWSKLNWRRPLLTLAVELYGKHGNPDSILAGFGTTVYLANNCITAKRIAFNFLLANAHRATMEFEAKAAGDSGAAEKKKDPKDMNFEEAKEMIYEMIEVYLDQHKEYALKSSVLEPTKYIYQLRNQEHNKNSNDVHGYNYPAAMVLSCLHVQLPMIPMMGDTYSDQGFLDVWDVEGSEEMWKLFKKPENFGRAFTGMKKPLGKISFGKSMKSKPPSGHFKDLGKVPTPKFIANVAVNPDTKYDNVRQHIGKKYISKFAYFFTKQFFLKKCFEVLNQEAIPEYIGFPQAFQKVFEEYKRLKKAQNEEIKDATVNEWLYDEYFIEIQIDRVWELFTFLNITKPPEKVKVIKDVPVGKSIKDWVLAAGVDEKLASELDDQGYDDLGWMISKAKKEDLQDMKEFCKLADETYDDLVDILEDW
eukprot:CAMPEP_0114518172 /NCGR_PEP_ID=MMETSP0109-20121206/18296_1 /TAXON_ID=29199 /ORGANISM="Chlorarachnion reptans, Strain CCCM449" /LENGTH=550 /DNA_ID=CAMNT_0001698763 /DNA_START=39 /DNA_END=1688 /DNA_ORIENTATION=-